MGQKNGRERSAIFYAHNFVRSIGLIITIS